MFCGSNDLFILLLLLCGCGDKNNCCGGGYNRGNSGDCCDLILWLILLNCICGDKNHCCK
ncbi:MAG: hypothetical protein IKC48_04285 [Clostridia bacterium]|nr:hypothetical protein [Clostridiales bacterium]MBR2970996.1 hypothetical protein [Clostridia bacterium]